MESKNFNLPLFLAGIFGFLGVAIGAFGAHGLKSVISPELMSVFETGTKYHLLHAIVMFVIAISDKYRESFWIRLGFWLISTGIIFFSGSLYILSITGVKILGAITPIGGLCFLAGWISISVVAFSRSK
ncbi:hypothetical protein CH373_00035 [Leptospira perolatii]|uniref:DUF423 domain-containing protein n=1 Tax=Leptospira perolatii TaxID=2023191 RepID=A0A2M9ZQZ3_9LEPT|nr:DUF423 domain-containing protein [Leptospira perolatii]PJZ70968.1 hypothetical protein CH360_00035 [Leptospira perolatii]PJZ74500.1 hypothetical protein CH373_00035 [Leptospira perolatii]